MVYGTNYANLDPVTNLTLVPNRAPVPQAPLPPDRAGNAGSVFTQSWLTLLQPGVWVGVAIGGAMIFMAMRLRRWRDEG